MRFKLLVFLLIVAAVLAACGGATTTPTAEPQTGDTTEEAGDATTTEEAEGGGDTTELSESFSGATAASGTLAFNYPAGYTQTGTADALVLTNADAGTGISVAVMPAVAASAMGATPAEIVTSFAANTPGVEFSEAEEVTFGSNSGALVTATTSGAETTIAVVEVGDNYVFLTFTGPESADNRATLEAVASSVTLE